jgi:hypothetical protein
MRALLIGLVVLCTTILTGGSVQNAEIPAPPDVTTSNWISIGDSFGFVIVSAGRTAKPRQAGQPTLSGYFMVKRGDVWFRLIEEPPGRIVPLEQN